MAGAWERDPLGRPDPSTDSKQPGSQVAIDVSVPGTSFGTITDAPLYLKLGAVESPKSLSRGMQESGQLWVHSVPREVVDSVNDKEKMRQCVINEVICTERDFVRDLEYLRDSCMTSLRTTNIIPEERRTDFVHQVFWNIEEIIEVNTCLRDLLTKRQQAHPVVEIIGDIFLELFPRFAPFVEYTKHQLFGEYELKKEKASNPAFAEFVETFKHLPASRRLELNGYLVKPLARLKRYPLMLEAVLRNTPEDNTDWVAIPEAVGLVRDLLKSAKEEYTKTENRLGLLQLDKRLVFRPGEEVDLNLMHEQRKLVYRGSLKGRSRTVNGNKDVEVFLLDHSLVMTQRKIVNENKQLKVIRRPIPLELLVVSKREEIATSAPGTRAAQVPVTPNSQETKHWLVFSRLGKWGYSLALCAPTAMAQRGWMEHITAQLQAVREQTMVFDTFMLSEILGGAGVNCVVPYGQCVVYGADTGVFFGMSSEGRSQTLVKVLDLPDIQQVDMLEEHKILIVLSGKWDSGMWSVLTFPLDVLEPPDPVDAMKRMKRISSRTKFFKVGRCLNRTLVCVVKGSSISSTVKVLEPINQNTHRKSTLDRLLQVAHDPFKVFREFYLPTEIYSIHFLKTKLCVACKSGFEVVDIQTLETQALLDPVDVSLNFVQSEKLALHYPYVMAFDSTFIEIRHVENGAPVQIIHGKDIRCLFSENEPSTINSSSTRSPDPQTVFNDQGGQAISSHTPHRTRPEILPDRPWRNKIIVLSDNQVMGVERAEPLSGVPVAHAPEA
ncbi:RHO1 GDP-GTP exchange protein 2 [Ceratobasidium sp. 370]|nr:RHO1 GDP-GTP exchange protein 2 [Ceratobasidium sp. 370]